MIADTHATVLPNQNKSLCDGKQKPKVEHKCTVRMPPQQQTASENGAVCCVGVITVRQHPS